jgi:hypothetical protein
MRRPVQMDRVRVLADVGRGDVGEQDRKDDDEH